MLHSFIHAVRLRACSLLKVPCIRFWRHCFRLPGDCLSRDGWRLTYGKCLSIQANRRGHCPDSVSCLQCGPYSHNSVDRYHYHRCSKLPAVMQNSLYESHGCIKSEAAMMKFLIQGPIRDKAGAAYLCWLFHRL